MYATITYSTYNFKMIEVNIDFVSNSYALHAVLNLKGSNTDSVKCNFELKGVRK
jgi:hypothetical protein